METLFRLPARETGAGKGLLMAVALLAWVVASASQAQAGQIFRFETDPFAGSTALTTPGRQVVGGEPFISFNIAEDLFSFDPNSFGINEINFFNGTIDDLPTSGVNVVVLQTIDNDANPATPFNAGSAANLIADKITVAGAGFFIYHNQGLGLNRLVYSTDLSDATADLKIVARMTNLTGQDAIDALPSFTEGNFDASVPEPATMSMLGGGLLLLWGLARRRQKATA
jgi:hypothetical protein